MTNTDPKNPLGVALARLREVGYRNNVATLRNAIEKATKRPFEKATLLVQQRELGANRVSIPKDSTRGAIDKGLRILGMEVLDWGPFDAALKARRSLTDRRRKEVRETLGLPPKTYTGGRSRVKAKATRKVSAKRKRSAA